MLVDQNVTANFDTTIVLNEDFDPVTSSLPSGWTKVVTAGAAGWWFSNTNYNTTGGTGGCALGATSASGSSLYDAELRTSAIDLTAYNSVGLEFKTSVENSSETADVDVSLNGASGPWTNVWRKVGRFTGPQTVTIDLTTAAAGYSNVMLRFHHSGTGVWWVLDDVKVMASATASDTTTTVASSANPSTSGQSVTFTATVSPGSATGTVTFKDGTTTLGSATLSGGTATYSTSALNIGSHTITATYSGDGSHNGSTSSSLDQTVEALPIDHFAITIAPGQTAGVPFSITVTALDAGNNTVTGYTGTVHFSANDPLAELPADFAFVTADNGSHAFSGVVLKTAGGRTITATDSVTSKTGTSASTAVAAASATKLVFIVQPSTTIVLQTISPAVQVGIQDLYGNTVTGSSATITLALQANPAEGTLGGTLSRAAVNGVTTFNDLSINNAGSGYSLLAASASLTAATSASFNIDLDLSKAVRVDPAQAFYATINEAYQGAADGSEIKATTFASSSSLLFNLQKAITLSGGYTANFSSNNSMTAITGTVTIGYGQVTISNIVIK